MRLHFLSKFFVVTLFLLCSLGDGDAQEQPSVETKTTVTTEVLPVAPVDPPPAPPVAVVVSPASADGMVSLDFQDADIKNVLKVLAYKSGMNIVAGPEVTGTVTIQLTDVPWQKALEVVLSTYGYGYERKGNIIVVTTVELLKKRHEDNQLLADQEPLVTKTYVLSFAKASDVIDSISKMKTPRGQINFDQRINAIILRDVQSNMDLMDDIIKTLDTPTPQVLIEARIIRTDFILRDNLGIDWNLKFSASGAKRPNIFPFAETQSGKFITGNFSTPPATAFTYGTLDASGLSATLQLLSTRTDTNVLSNPRIVTLDNQTAKIVVGEKYPLPQYTYNSEQGKMQLSGYEYLDIGIIFEVTPHVNNSGLVTLDLYPKITANKGGVKVDPSSEALIPVLSTEEAKTRVMIRDGETLVIAGLIKDTVIGRKSKVPFLGDIPVIGKAFKNQGDDKDKTELIIFLTPHIITANALSEPAPAATK